MAYNKYAMSYSKQIPLELISELVAMLEERIEGYTITSQLFFIQYSYFEKQQNGKWILKNFLDIGDETIKNIFLQISDNNKTNFVVHGENSKFGVLHINKILDMRNKSIIDKIYACDLYIDFKPQHFVGKCYTKKN